MVNRDDVAKRLAIAHHETEPTIERVVRLISDQEFESHEPLKLLEVNSATPQSGIVPIAFGADSPNVPLPLIIVEVTPAEYLGIVEKTLSLPHGWVLGDTIYDASSEHAHVA